LTIGVAGAGAARDYPIRPVPFNQVQLEDAFWAPRLEVNRTVTIPFALRQNDTTGRVDNFRNAARHLACGYKGERYNDTDVYKVIEGAAYALAQHPDAELERRVDALIALIRGAQEPDGYLFTPRTVDPACPAPGTGSRRWSELGISHELYNMGHLMEAAVAYHQATGKRDLLDVALKAGDLIAGTFGREEQKRHGYPGHQEVELGLVKLYRATGQTRFLDTARYFLDARGRAPGVVKEYPVGTRWAIYNDPVQIQADRPILEQRQARGHAVRASYMFAALADVAALTGREEYAAAIDRIWADVTSRKMYLTGGIGARHDRERFGEAYELPNLTAYAETCAAIGSVFWNHRLFLLHGDAKYVDVLERTAYNGLLSGVSLSGDRFFYPNPLASDGKYAFNKGSAERAPWFGVACCPGNLTRFLASLAGYVYARQGETLFVNLFVQGRGRIDLPGRAVQIQQATRYPWDGNVKITLHPSSAGEFTLAVRIPGWVRGEIVPNELYSSLGAEAARPRRERGPPPSEVSLRVNGKAVALNLEKGFARVRRDWHSGDTVELDLPMKIQRVVARPEVEADRGRVALQRGPLVYCAEAVDQPSRRAMNLILTDAATLSARWRGELLGGVTALEGRAQALQADGSLAQQDFVAIPYYAWNNRGANEMVVWLPRDREALARVERRLSLEED